MLPRAYYNDKVGTAQAATFDLMFDRGAVCSFVSTLSTFSFPDDFSLQ